MVFRANYLSTIVQHYTDRLTVTDIDFVDWLRTITARPFDLNETGLSWLERAAHGPIDVAVAP